MTGNRRPRSITIIGWLFVAVGAAGLLKDLWPLVTPGAAEQLAKLKADGFRDLGPAWASRLAAVIGGMGLLRGTSWARWLLAAWMAFHIWLSVFHSWEQLLIHCAVFLPIVYFLFRRPPDA